MHQHPASNRLSLVRLLLTALFGVVSLIAVAPAGAEPVALIDLVGQPVQLCGPSATFSGTVEHAESLAVLADAQPRGVWVVVVVDVVNDGPRRSWLFESAQLADESDAVARNDTISSVPAAAASARFRVKSQETYLSPGERARVALVFDVSPSAAAFELLPIFDYCP